MESAALLRAVRPAAKRNLHTLPLLCPGCRARKQEEKAGLPELAEKIPPQSARRSFKFNRFVKGDSGQRMVSTPPPQSTYLFV